MHTAVAHHVARAHASLAEFAAAHARYQVIRRNGASVSFDANKIVVAMTKAFLAVEGDDAAASRRIRETVEGLTAHVSEALFRRLPEGGTVHIEDIQDQVELALMRGGHLKVARAYVLNLEEHARRRERHDAQDDNLAARELLVVLDDGTPQPLVTADQNARLKEACDVLYDVHPESFSLETLLILYDVIPLKEFATALI